MENFKDHLEDFFKFFSSKYPIETYEFNSFSGAIIKRKSDTDFIDCIQIVYGYTRGWIFCEDLAALMKFLKVSAKIMSHVR
jgi:hypothetical protein